MFNIDENTGGEGLAYAGFNPWSWARSLASASEMVCPFEDLKRSLADHGDEPISFSLPFLFAGAFVLRLALVFLRLYPLGERGTVPTSVAAYLVEAARGREGKSIQSKEYHPMPACHESAIRLSTLRKSNLRVKTIL